MADSAGGAWTFGGSILTFAFPMILFIVVAGALYILYTKPEMVPGHQVRPPERPVSYTAVPGQPTTAPATGHEAPAGPAAGGTAETTGETTTGETTTGDTTTGEAAGTGDAE